MTASGWRCWVLIRHLIALDLNEAFLFSAIPIGEAAADNTKRLPAVRIDRVRAKKAESSGHRLFVLFAGASRAVVGGKLCPTRAEVMLHTIAVSFPLPVPEEGLAIDRRLKSTIYRRPLCPESG